jgi:hypothetical protein
LSLSSVAEIGERERRQRRAGWHQHVLTAVDHVCDRPGVERRAGLEVPQVLAALASNAIRLPDPPANTRPESVDNTPAQDWLA